MGGDVEGLPGVSNREGLDLSPVHPNKTPSNLRMPSTHFKTVEAGMRVFLSLMGPSKGTLKSPHFWGCPKRDPSLCLQFGFGVWGLGFRVLGFRV